MPNMVLRAAVLIALFQSPVVLRAAPNPSATYEAEEVRILAAALRRIRSQAGGTRLCVELNARGHLANVRNDIHEDVRVARRAGEPGFGRVARALSRSDVQVAMEARQVDGRMLAAALGADEPTFATRCDAPVVIEFYRTIQSGSAAAVWATWAGGCGFSTVVIGLRKRHRSWQVDGFYFLPSPSWLCIPPLPGEERRRPAGNFLMVGG